MLTSIDYADLLVNFSTRSKQKIKAASDELQKRRLLKRHFIHQLVITKMISRRLKQEHARHMVEGEQYKYLRQLTGEFVLELLRNMDDARIRLSENEYRDIFNISAEVWRANYDHRKPDKVMDVVFVEKLSDEPMIDFMVDAMFNKLTNNPKTKQQMDNYMRYELGLPI